MDAIKNAIKCELSLRLLKVIAVLLCFLFCAWFAQAQRVEDVVTVKGLDENHLIGQGIVVGLAGTGGKGNLVAKHLKSMYAKLGLKNIDIKDIDSKNVAVVVVTARLSPFATEGAKLDVTVSSVGSASSLSGGQLLMTPLKGVDGEVYALAGGSLVLGKSKHLTHAQIPSGAIVQEEIKTDFVENGQIRLMLSNANFLTARHIENVINQDTRTRNDREGIAKAVNGGLIVIDVPAAYRNNPVRFISRVLQLPVILPNHEATVVINERTGTIIIDDNVSISPVGINQDGLSIKVPVSDNPAPTNNVYGFSPGGTAAGRPHVLPAGTKLKDVVDALNALQVSTQDLIAILQSLKKAGALHAKLVIM